MRVDLATVEEVAKDLYIRAVKILPDDVKRGFERLSRSETNPRARQMLREGFANTATAKPRRQ